MKSRSAGGISFDVSGLEGVTTAMLKVGTETRKAAVRVVRESGERVKSNAKHRAPHDKGTLAESIKRKATNGGLGQRIYTNDKVGIFQEFGTKKMPAHPFLFPALEEERPHFAANLGDAIRDAANGATTTRIGEVVLVAEGSE